MSELDPQIGINVQLFNKRLNKGGEADNSLTWLREVMQGGELLFLLTFGGGHEYTIVAKKDGETDDEAASLTMKIEQPDGEFQRPRGDFHDGSEEITLADAAHQMKLIRKLNEFFTREFNAGRTMISIAATALLNEETDE